MRASFANTDAALVLVAVVVAVAADGALAAGYLAAASSAVCFDFFLTQPYERFTISRRSDIETTVLLLVICVAVTELAVWGAARPPQPAGEPDTSAVCTPPPKPSPQLNCHPTT